MSFPQHIGDYRVVRELGRGGMGVVLEAVQESLDRRVALKLLSGVGGDGGKAVERFAREARAAARLTHPGIVQVHGFGEDQGLHYIAMEYVDGESLSQYLERFWRDPDAAPPTGSTTEEATFHLDMDASGAIPEPEIRSASTSTLHRQTGRRLRPVVGMIIQAARALHAAHEAHVLHRDVKPGNLMVMKDGTVKVADFGLAQIESGDRLTRTGDLMGTPTYVSPEQIRGGTVDRRADVYSLGVTLYESLCGAPPFEADGVQALLHRILHREPKSPRKLNAQLPRDLDTICLRAIEKEPDRRYPTAAELADDLQRWLDNEPIHARPAGPVTRAVKFVRRRRGLVASALVLTAAIVGLVMATQLAETKDREAQSKDFLLRRERANIITADGISNSVQGNGPAAIAAYDRAIAADPDHPIALTFRGLEHMNRNEIDLGKRDLQAVLEKDATCGPARLAWAVYLRRTGADAATIEPWLLPATPADTDDPLELDALGLAFQQFGLHREAHGFFAKARGLDRGRISSLVGQGLAAFHLGRYRESEDLFLAAQQLLPSDNPLPPILLVFCFSRQSLAATLHATPEVTGKVREQYLDRARRLLDPRSSSTTPTVFDALACAAVDFMIPDEQRSPSDHPPGACLAEAAALAGDPSGRRLPPLFHEVAAHLLLDRDGWDRRMATAEPDGALLAAAQNAAELALAQRPNSYPAKLALALVAARSQRPALAAEHLASALRLAPDGAEALSALLDLATKHPTSVDGDAALAAARTLVEIEPDSADAALLAARVLRSGNDAAWEVRALRRALDRLGPDRGTDRQQASERLSVLAPP